MNTLMDNEGRSHLSDPSLGAAELGRRAVRAFGVIAYRRTVT
jgi:hypothetical protein